MWPGSWFHVKLWPGQDSTLKFDPGSWFNVELWPRVLILRWIMTPGLNSMWIVTLWPGIGIIIQCVILTRVTIQRWILTRLHIIYPWNCDSRRCQYSTAWSKFNSYGGSQFNEKSIEYWPGVDFQWRGQNFILHRHVRHLTRWLTAGIICAYIYV